MELLKNLQSESLLTPLTTILTAFIALSAVLINNLSVWLNTRYQLNRNSKESDKKNKLDMKTSALQEKRVKLELLHENLQHFLEISNDSINRVEYLIHYDDLSALEREKALSETSDNYFKVQRYRRKAEVLGSSYSDNLTHEFSQLKNHASAIKDAISHLTMLSLAEHTIGAEPEYKKDANKTCRVCIREHRLMKELVDKIEQTVIEERRASREDIMLIRNKQDRSVQI